MGTEDGRKIYSVGGDDVSESRSGEAQAGLAHIIIKMFTLNSRFSSTNFPTTRNTHLPYYV